ncbi:S41 family peptidase [Roseateles amylovorans]|uniref:S41 family peptidase n=1 Tax=Roseateles amylovorans TaxID=2978473 RepID=A0ABY6B0L9_9BURK|nr:S41 family peptidase [Roseateles amylovorans]UXH78747.1 S41 family peptidase [Roseateles amylovorans]
MRKSAILRSARLAVVGAISVLLLQACGGGGGPAGDPVVGSGSGSGSGGGGTGSGGSGGTPGALGASSTYAQRCAPGNTEAASNLRTGSLSVEKNWVRSYMDEAYLWRDEVPTVSADAAAYSGSDVGLALSAYFDALLTPATTASGKRRDQFSFTMSTREWNDLSGSGVAVGYGIEWSLASTTPPRNIRVAYVEPGSAAANAGVQRGDVLVSADGATADVATSAGVDTLNAALFPSVNGSSHSFVLTSNIGTTRNVTMVSASVTKTPVLQRQVLTAADGASVGYMVFNDHIAPAEAQLIAAIQDFKNRNVTDLVLDMRYNGGGYLFIASELAYMIAGAGPTSGKTFEQLRYNSRRSADTNSSDARTPFYTSSCGLTSSGTCSQQAPLPTLNLRRVFVLAQSGTCSASEALINGLRGVDVEVVLIGGTTCGKPYGFTAKDNCGYSYFPIEFVGTNNKGFGEYADGFVPGGSGTTGVKGCAVRDDFTRQLGDQGEGMLAAALQYRTSSTCPAQAADAGPDARAQAASLSGASVELKLQKLAARTNRIDGGRH